MKELNRELNGAWEERGVFGTRVEIDGKRITVLWQNAPVLETTFQTEESGDGLLLKLKQNGLRYAGAAGDYAAVKQLIYHDGGLTFTKLFLITGESTEQLSRTENSRYGNYAVVNDVLRDLQGSWKSADGFFSVTIRQDEMTLNGEKTKICVLRSKDPHEPKGRYVIADRDPSVTDWQGFSRFIYENGVLRANLLVCDAPSKTVVFKKE